MSNVANFASLETIEEEASLWIVKFEGDDEPADGDIVEFNAWMNQSEVHRDTLLKLSASWSEMDMLSQLAVPVKEKTQDHRSWFKALLVVCISPFITRRDTQVSSKDGVATFGSFGAVAVTAFSIALIFSVGIYFSPDLLSNKSNLYSTKLGQQLNQTLPDGSTLWLNTDSEVEVRFEENLRRLNLIKGEAHFEVVHNPERPFEVYVGDRMVRAVGTAFSVRKHSHIVKVTVTEGKVDLAIVEESPLMGEMLGEELNTQEKAGDTTLSNKTVKTESVIGSLIAGQSVSLPDSSAMLESTELVAEVAGQIVTVELHDLKRKMSWMEGTLVFAGESLDEVVSEVSRYAPIRIEVADTSLSTLRIGGQFQVGKTDELFDVLQSSFGVEVRYLDDRHVQIHAK